MASYPIHQATKRCERRNMSKKTRGSNLETCHRLLPKHQHLLYLRHLHLRYRLLRLPVMSSMRRRYQFRSPFRITTRILGHHSRISQLHKRRPFSHPTIRDKTLATSVKIYTRPPKYRMGLHRLRIYHTSSPSRNLHYSTTRKSIQFSNLHHRSRENSRITSNMRHLLAIPLATTLSDTISQKNARLP
jgi:hypothetical protein